MNPRVGFSLVFIFLSAILAVCSVLARKSKRSIGPYVSRFCLSLILPLAGNLIILLPQLNLAGKAQAKIKNIKA